MAARGPNATLPRPRPILVHTAPPELSGDDGHAAANRLPLGGGLALGPWRPGPYPGAMAGAPAARGAVDGPPRLTAVQIYGKRAE